MLAKDDPNGYCKTLENTRLKDTEELCLDCGVAKNPRWAEIRNGALLCLECSGYIRRHLGVECCQLRSIFLDSWSGAQASRMVLVDNNLIRAWRTLCATNALKKKEIYTHPSSRAWCEWITAQVDGSPSQEEGKKKAAFLVLPYLMKGPSNSLCDSVRLAMQASIMNALKGYVADEQLLMALATLPMRKRMRTFFAMLKRKHVSFDRHLRVSISMRLLLLAPPEELQLAR